MALIDVLTVGEPMTELKTPNMTVDKAGEVAGSPSLSTGWRLCRAVLFGLTYAIGGGLAMVLFASMFPGASALFALVWLLMVGGGIVFGWAGLRIDGHERGRKQVLANVAAKGAADAAAAAQQAIDDRRPRRGHDGVMWSKADFSKEWGVNSDWVGGGMTQKSDGARTFKTVILLFIALVLLPFGLIPISGLLVFFAAMLNSVTYGAWEGECPTCAKPVVFSDPAMSAALTPQSILCPLCAAPVRIERDRFVGAQRADDVGVRMGQASQ